MASAIPLNTPPTIKTGGGGGINSGTGRRGIQGEKWTSEEEVRLRALWVEFRSRSANRYAPSIWLPISERMSGRKPDACHQKAYRMGLLSDGEKKAKRVSRDGVVDVTGLETETEGGPAEVRREKRQREPVSVDVELVEVDDIADVDEDVAAVDGGTRAEPRREPRPEEAWKHDRHDARGKAWRLERHEAKTKWGKGVHRANLDRFCPACCEGCAEESVRAKKPRLIRR